MSEVIDPGSYRWASTGWQGRPWHEAIIYELHVGTFTPEGTFAAASRRLDHLAALGVTALELMPVAEFPGRRGWGYDGVLLFATESAYGRPEDLKALVDAAHAHGLMVMLDVVFNHFGPEGNLLAAYAPDFFDPRQHTPWGAAIDFRVDARRAVREFFVQAALHWIGEYRFDGLRFDAAHAIRDESDPHVLDEIAGAIRQGPGGDRHVHLVLENDANEVSFLAARAAGSETAGFDAQWNDDLHHVLHHLLTGESSGYYRDYADAPMRHLGRCLSEGFAFQGERSAYRDARRGEPSGLLPASAFVAFLQNHDQIGNRAFGERLGQLVDAERLRLGVALVLLSPAIPMLFMGEEWNASTPFRYFCDYEPELATRIRDGRRAEFARFAECAVYAEAPERDRIPDPNAIDSFAVSVLRWEERCLPQHAPWLDFYRHLLRLRRAHLVPAIASGIATADHAPLSPRALAVHFRFGSGARLRLAANFADDACTLPHTAAPLLFATRDAMLRPSAPPTLPAWSMAAHFSASDDP